MTFEESQVEKMKNNYGKMHSKRINSKELSDLGIMLHEVLQYAYEEGRLVFGVEDCSKLLEIGHCHTFFCVLLDPAKCKDNVSLHMFLVLIEAFCVENHVFMIKLDEAAIENVRNCLNGFKNGYGAEKCFNCMIIETPRNDLSSAEKQLINRMRGLDNRHSPHPD